MHDRQQFRHAIAIAAFGLIGLAFFFLVAGIAGRARGGDGCLPRLHRRAHLRVVGDRQIPGRPVVGGPGGGGDSSPADQRASEPDQVHRFADFANEEVNEGGIE
jgi:hypothetical protein